jgi:5-methyltetrahydropteroyltriglutamate--homocysteine methyltransferase
MPLAVTHVGSLPRRQRTVDQIFARERNAPWDRATFDHIMAEEVTETVRRQTEAGVSIVSDGETSKISYATYVKDRYTGFDGDSPRQAPADLKQFPSFLQRLADSGGTPTYSRPCCVGPVAPKDDHDLQADIAHLQAAMQRSGVVEGFLNAASPGVIALFLPNQHYPDHESYLNALGEALQHEYRAIINAGLQLQIDCPDLALSRHMLFMDKSDADFVRLADLHVSVLNNALAGLPKERIRLHICWGNYEGPHTCDIDMERVFSTLMRTHAQYLLFENANPRHGHEWTVFAERRAEIPEDKVLVPGVVDTTTNFVEHPRLVTQRLQRFVEIVGRERVVAGTDCGFGTFAGFGAVDPEIAYAKLQTLAQGAADV